MSTDTGKRKTTSALAKHAKELGYPKELIAPILTPIQIASAIVFQDPEAGLQQVAQRLNDYQLQKLELLFRHYGISATQNDGAFKLLIAVLTDWVPGFTISDHRVRGKGKPKKLNSGMLLARYCDIERVRTRGPRHELSAACAKFKKLKGLKSAVRTLENQYRAGKEIHEEHQKRSARLADVRKKFERKG
jgi:hypothetical protein